MTRKLSRGIVYQPAREDGEKHLVVWYLVVPVLDEPIRIEAKLKLKLGYLLVNVDCK